MSRVVAITQARMTSSRLPGKILREARGKSLLQWHLERVARCPGVADVVVATTTNTTDDPVVAMAERLGFRWYRGPEDDVLMRFVGAAREARADVIVRVTSDCPLWDPEEGARVVRAVQEAPGVDYASNVAERSYPRGLDTEALWRDVLERVARLAPAGACPEREHVTWMVHAGRPELFLRRSVRAAADDSDLRWCVDVPDDYACARAILEGLDDPMAAYPDVLRFVRARPDIASLNVGVAQKPR